MKRLEVRYDSIRTVGQASGLGFSARNITEKPQFAHGIYLIFTGTGPGEN